MIESCRIGLQKPDPKIYEYALHELNVTPEEVSDFSTSSLTDFQLYLSVSLTTSASSVYRDDNVPVWSGDIFIGIQFSLASLDVIQ